jgi:excisionase family DNA binding protein
MKKLLTTEEAAEFLGMSYQFLERDRWKGATIPYVRVGSRSIRYRFEDLENYLSSRVVKAVENGNETLQ